MKAVVMELDALFFGVYRVRVGAEVAGHKWWRFEKIVFGYKRAITFGVRSMKDTERFL